MHRNTYISPRTDFGKPPKGYISGAGRGAVGFTTRSDIGPARQAVVPIDRSISAQKERARQILLQRQLGIPNTNNNGPMLPATPSALVGGIQTEMKKEDTNKPTPSNHDTEDLNDSNYDPFTGYTSNLFSADNYDDEDREADIIYQTIDARQDSKRKQRREEREKKQWEEYHKKRPKVHEYFRSEKRELANLHLSEWMNIPEPMDLSRKRRKLNKSTRSEKYTPVPDSIIENAHNRNSTKSMIDDMDGKYGGWETNAPIGTTGTMTTDLTQLGRARDRHLGIQLDKMADSVTGQTVVDPKGYLTDLTSISITSDTDVSDIRKARQLLKSVVTTNPKHPPGWIAAARLEQAAGKISAARNMIMRGTVECPSSQDIWIEASQLHAHCDAKRILAMAVKKIPKSVKIWLRAAALEVDDEDKKAVLRKALELIPNSVVLWRNAVDLESADNARIMLSRAVECVPSSVEMWIALSKLESYSNAKKVLNRARTCCPSEKLIFIESAKLEENNSNADNVQFIISKAIKTLSANKIVINREHWFADAARCENSRCFVTCSEIVHQVMDYDEERIVINDEMVSDADKLMKYKSEAEEWLHSRKQIHVSRSIYKYILRKWNDNWRIWWDAAQLERKHGDIESTQNILRSAVRQCPKSINLWLFCAKIAKNCGQIDISRTTLSRALEINAECVESEKIWLALCRLEISCGDFAAAAVIMDKARSECNTEKIWLHSAKLLRRMNGAGSDSELNLELNAVKRFASFDKLWMMLLQCAEHRNEYHKCEEYANMALSHCQDSINVWLEYARILSEKLNKFAKARSVLQNATLSHPRNDRLWLAAAKLELFEETEAKKGTIYRDAAGYQECKSLIARGLQQCTDSGALYAFSIEIEPIQSKKSKCVLSIKKCPNNVYVFVEIAKYFVQIRKVKRAKEWFERAVIADEKYGDAWAYYYWSQKTQNKENIATRCCNAMPKYGQLWIKVSKKIGNEDLKKGEILLKVVEQYIEPYQGFPIRVI